MQSLSFVDAAMQPGVAGPSKSPVFDFDDVWADHVLALRNTAKASLGDGCWPLMEGVSPTLGVKPEEASMHWTTFAGAPVAHAVLPPYHHHQLSDVESWMNSTHGAPTTTYGSMFPNTFEGYMMPIDQTSSTTSVSTLESPRSSRGSKRPPSTDDDEDDDSPLEFASSKAKRPRFDVNPPSSSSYSSSYSGNGVHIASAAPANNALFMLPNDTNTNINSTHLDGVDAEGGFWETVQGPWELSDIPPPPPSHRTNAFFPVRAMPPLQVPVPRLPQQIWSAAAALGSSK